MRQETPILLSDVDGVAIDWLQGYINFNAEHGHYALHNQPSDFAMRDIFPTLEKPWERIMEYQNSHHYTNLKAYDDTKQAYSKIHELGAKIIFISSCGTTDFIKKARIDTLNRELEGKFDDIIMLEIGASKLDVLKKFPSSVWIEDQMKFAIEGAIAGHRSFLRNMPYNKMDSHPKVNRLSAMNTLMKHFQKSRDLEKECTGIELQ